MKGNSLVSLFSLDDDQVYFTSLLSLKNVDFYSVYSRRSCSLSLAESEGREKIGRWRMRRKRISPEEPQTTDR